MTRDEVFEEAAQRVEAHGRELEDEYGLNNGRGDTHASVIRALKTGGATPPTDPKAMPPEEAALMSEMLRQKERADEAERNAAFAQAACRRLLADCETLTAERDALKARLDKVEADAEAAMERVERLTWEANGAKMGGET